MFKALSVIKHTCALGQQRLTAPFA